MKVPFIDLKAQFETIRDEISVAMAQVLESSAFAGGPFVERFETEFAQSCQCKHAVGLGSGTEAIWLALLALGIGHGDEVITVPNTFIATAEAISFCGAQPLFVDIDEQTYNMDPQRLNDYLKRRFFHQTSRPAPWPKVVIPVHLFGQMADMDPIVEIAKAYELFVVEDACQAHGAEYKGRPAGSIGDLGCFSFYPGKNLGAYGEAGAVVTDDADLADKIRLLRDHGQPVKYHHAVVGWNARMDGLQGAVLGVKLRHLAAWNESRRKNARTYNALLTDTVGIKIPREAAYARHVYHVYAIRTKQREALMRALVEKDIHCGIHYPIPVHLQRAYQGLHLREGTFPIAELCASEFLSLPMFPELSKEQIEYVVTEIEHFMENQ
jgi:dTDP-4-amino-4,6-dideoxygalactose transaminase